MQDVSGKELKVGDKLAYITKGGSEATALSIGIITGFTKQKIKIHASTFPFGLSSAEYYARNQIDCMKFPYQVSKIEE